MLKELDTKNENNELKRNEMIYLHRGNNPAHIVYYYCFVYNFAVAHKLLRHLLDYLANFGLTKCYGYKLIGLRYVVGSVFPTHVQTQLTCFIK